MDEHQMKDAALRLALEGFENIRHHFDTDEYAHEVAVKSITAIKQALKQPELEPVAWGMRNDDGKIYDCICPKEHDRVEGEYTVPLYTSPQQPEQDPVAWKDKTYGNLHHQDFGNSTPLYTSPPKREWQGLTDEEMHECWDSPLTPLGMKHARMIEAKLKEKNT